jgi:hypothetical protein
MSAHRHESARESRAYPYSGPVRRSDEPAYNPAAHGGCAYHQTCACGATRWRLASGGQEELGEWASPELRSTLTLRITQELSAALDAAAQTAGVTRSDAARDALARGLNR